MDAARLWAATKVAITLRVMSACSPADECFNKTCHLHLQRLITRSVMATMKQVPHSRTFAALKTIQP